MMDVAVFYGKLLENNLNFFAGVPDSLLKDLCAYIADNAPRENNIITSNEGSAIGLAAGYYLATERIPVVYMQNSGLGNATNPLLSLADQKVYKIPMILVIGWRGEPGTKDEPQHLKQGEVTLKMLECMEIPYIVLSKDQEIALKQTEDLVNLTISTSIPHAIVIQKDTFNSYSLKNKPENCFLLTREEAIKVVISQIGKNDIVISTTGKLSRELYEYRKAIGCSNNQDFLTVGSMGHSSSIALGIALFKPKSNVFCLDGDGSFLMHLGAITNIGALKPNNFKHIIFNNGVHESVGGQPTVAFKINIPSLVKACKYEAAFTARSQEEIESALTKMKSLKSPVLLEIFVNNKSRSDLGRPLESPVENKIKFIDFIKTIK